MEFNFGGFFSRLLALCKKCFGGSEYHRRVLMNKYNTSFLRSNTGHVGRAKSPIFNTTINNLFLIYNWTAIPGAFFVTVDTVYSYSGTH